jgi:copper chaperone NosL
MKHLLLTLALSLALFSCTIEPSEIIYGSDGCHYCKMTIVDRQHAAQIVTSKGKPFKYDAIECMANDLISRDINTISYFLINDYASPGDLIDATKSTFLISKSIPSPMGAFLSGFKDEITANKFQKKGSDEILTWNKLKNRFLPRQE